MDRTGMDPNTPRVGANTPPALTALAVVALVLLVIGGLNWALVGLFNFDLVAAIFGEMSTPSRVVYVIVGLAAIYALTLLPRLSRLR